MNANEIVKALKKDVFCSDCPYEKNKCCKTKGCVYVNAAALIEQQQAEIEQQQERIQMWALSSKNTADTFMEQINMLLVENNQLKTRLENSVEMPCKVGDTVYSLIGYPYSREKNKPYKCTVVFIGINEKYKMLNVKFFQSDYMWQFNEDDINKTVFLTKSEAEQALKEREDND